MADVGSAFLNVIPKIKGLSDAVQKEMDKAEAVAAKKGASSGQRFSTGFSGGAIKAGAAVGAASAIVNKAMSAVSSHVESAISRFDTLNNYPTVMTALGYSAQDADASISKMSDRLQGLPTTLDSMVSLVQGLVTTTGDLGKATDAGLALNDMLVAAGASTQLTNAAMEQFRQILSKGKPEMEDWRSLTSAMPGQMDQLAKAMLGPTANANDLYAALGGGKNEAILSMDDLLDAMIRLDAQGGEGFASFQEQAETAAGGVSTAMANCSNAVTRGIASMLDTIGKDAIAGGFNDTQGRHQRCIRDSELRAREGDANHQGRRFSGQGDGARAGCRRGRVHRRQGWRGRRIRRRGIGGVRHQRRKRVHNGVPERIGSRGEGERPVQRVAADAGHHRPRGRGGGRGGEVHRLEDEDRKP